MKKDNTITVFYDEAKRKDIYRLNGIDVTDTIEMLKDKWERQILDTRCRLFQLDMTIQQRLQDQISDLEAKLADMGKEIAIRNQKLNELKNELHKRDESLQRKKQQVGDVHKAVKQAKRESARKGRQVCIANNEVVQYQKQIRLLKQQLAEKEQTIEEINKEFVEAVKDWKSLVEQKNRDIAELEEHDRVYHNQLAIAELEKVKSGLYSIPTPYDMITSLPISGNTFSNGFHKGMYKVIELIDNQIKQLKEMK